MEEESEELIAKYKDLRNTIDNMICKVIKYM